MAQRLETSSACPYTNLSGYSNYKVYFRPGCGPLVYEAVHSYRRITTFNPIEYHALNKSKGKFVPVLI
jgi:hypothetical protein